ncbi:dihydrouridine synthase [Bdellovibrio sp. qaytius]|nr:dihydrouridine synthase [Bdellovibrio sp. qaytius]
MEGVTDWAMRDLLTSLGGIDQCVTEFLRVTDKLHPYKVFEKNCPELKTGSRTRSGTPVFVQLLGGQAIPLAENAVRAHEMGALGVDLNFGCPAKTVNRHDGGASLLKSSDRLYNIVKTVRDAVPASTPVTAKVRLGFDDPSHCLDNVKACEDAGATWVTVHCRTKTDGYKPPAYWEWIPKIQERTKVKIIANGEIWNVEDFKKCKAETNCADFMIGRGALRNPYVFSEIKAHLQTEQSQSPNSLELIVPFFDACTVYVNDHFATARTKQWLSQLRIVSPKAREIFDQVKVHKKPIEFKTHLEKLLN